MHAKRGGSANLAACPPHNQHPIIDCASYITPKPSLNTTNTHRDSVHLLHSRPHNSTYFPLNHRHSLRATTPTPTIDSRLPPPWLPTDISHSPTRAPTMPRTTSTSTNPHTRTSLYPDTAHHSRQHTVPHPKAALTPQAMAPRAQTMASAHFLDNPAYQGRWEQVRVVLEQDG
jgi:hypothetical protein